MLDTILKIDVVLRAILGSIAILFYAFVLLARYILYKRKDKELDKLRKNNEISEVTPHDDNR